MYPQRSVMTCGLATALEPPHFNPRTRVGCDTMTSQFCRHFVRVSIHAPAWGTTLRQTSGQRLDSCFNPRTRVGCDAGCVPYGGCRVRFNPRTRVGCDHITTAHQLADGLVSIHAPAWGATAYQYVAGYVTKFQSTHPRGVRLLPQIGADAIIRFQSTHPRGVRRTQTRVLSG